MEAEFWLWATGSRSMDAISDTTATAAPETAAKPAEASLTQAVRWRVPVVSVPHATAGQSRYPSLPSIVALVIFNLTLFVGLASRSVRDKPKSESAIASEQEVLSGNAVTTEDVTEKKDAE